MSGERKPQVDVRPIRDAEEILAVEGEDGMHYRWVNDSPQRIARHKMKGYEFARADEVSLAIEPDTTVDGTVRVGDAVLMKCPVEDFQQRRVRAQQLSEARLGTPKEDAERQARAKGVRTFTDKE